MAKTKNPFQKNKTLISLCWFPDLFWICHVPRETSEREFGATSLAHMFCSSGVGITHLSPDINIT